ncbi:MAG: DUF1616 domain-containing protein [Chloroflexi bacterium]|nr:DUF1616 domain-containing protein [Chloroflexota bacterium]
MSKFNKGLTIFLVIAIVATIGGIIYLSLTPKPGDRFTEFYILGITGRASDYPKKVTLGNSAEVIIGVVNREGQTASYQVSIAVDGVEDNKVDVGTLANGQKWEQKVSFSPKNTGDGQKIEFYLYKDGSDKPHIKDPLRLFIDVRPP